MQLHRRSSPVRWRPRMWPAAGSPASGATDRVGLPQRTGESSECTRTTGTASLTHEPDRSAVAEGDSFTLKLTERRNVMTKRFAGPARLEIARQVERDRGQRPQRDPATIARCIGARDAIMTRNTHALRAFNDRSDRFEPGRRAVHERTRRSIQHDGASFTLAHDEQRAIRKYGQRLGVLWAIGIGESHRFGLSRSHVASRIGLGDSIDHQRAPLRVVVADVADVQARSVRARPDGDVLPVVDGGPRDPEATDTRA